MNSWHTGIVYQHRVYLIDDSIVVLALHEVGLIKETIKNAILDGLIPNEYEPAYTLMLEEAHKLGLSPKK